MRIKLHFPEQSITLITAMGLSQKSPETLRLVREASGHVAGVLRRGNSTVMLTGDQFVQLRRGFGAWIECDSEYTTRRVRIALATANTGMDEHVQTIQTTETTEE